MKAIVIGSTKQLLFFAIYGFFGSIIVFLAAAVWLLNARSELDLWHTTELKHEYHQQSGLKNFDEYMALEKDLFSELDNKIYQTYQPSKPSPINRYETGSLSDPRVWQTNWNRSFEWSNPSAEYGVLFIHGMSDSPYAISHLAKHFRDSAYVLGLRLPGHGTIPAGLTGIAWPDLASAVKLATEHMKSKLNGKPLYVVGFSTGAALALNLELENSAKTVSGTLSIDSVTSNDSVSASKPETIQPVYSGMVFISPAIGLQPIAAGAKWQAMLGNVLGYEKLFWNSISVEYDPFKYASFAVNAGDVVYQLSQRNYQITSTMNNRQLQALPPILTFQSLADDTVSSTAVVDHLYQFLPSDKHELVIFDINRNPNNRQLIVNDPMEEMSSIWLINAMNYKLTMIENDIKREHYVQQTRVQKTSIQQSSVQMTSAQQTTSQQAIVQQHEMGGGDSQTSKPLALEWPRGVYSLSHVALPFPESDPLYGPNYLKETNHIQIGQAKFTGERGLFGIPAAEMLRQKWNPFYPFMIEQMEAFIEP
ncbi:alpha/beta fold hydrolase [Shewanella olleyana]|uniref:alpha/beta hydrolase n=1 Tax=Shewanella olleyana TaxID=135626 RepID=UPI00200CDDC0|nr:alpha/beta fold hydrolase [Shewanella olleyana]MCL1066301.1 alpha/beta fold hydrolase [Shewanella olleyana]